VSSGHPGSRRRNPRFAAWGCGALVAGCLLLVGCQASGGEPQAAEPAPPARATGAVGSARPVSIRIPAIGVDARVVAVGLGRLRRSDRIVVGRAGGGARSFVVERVERQPKQALPVARIWNPTRRPVLRLITCGGSFDRATGHYRDNVIVYASLAGS